MEVEVSWGVGVSSLSEGLLPRGRKSSTVSPVNWSAHMLTGFHKASSPAGKERYMGRGLLTLSIPTSLGCRTRSTSHSDRFLLGLSSGPALTHKEYWWTSTVTAPRIYTPFLSEYRFQRISLCTPPNTIPPDTPCHPRFILTSDHHHQRPPSKTRFLHNRRRRPFLESPTGIPVHSRHAQFIHSMPRRIYKPKSSSGGGVGQKPPREITVSKALSFLLRHGATTEGIEMDDAGFANVADVVGQTSSI